MNININTKFNVGDTVYKPVFYNDEWFPEDKQYIVCRIHIQIKDKPRVSYELSDDFGLYPYAENMLFKSYKDCKQFVNDCNNGLTNNGIGV